jgi:signal transduction histidine kinase/CheY-like chemotaxis protein
MKKSVRRSMLLLGALCFLCINAGLAHAETASGEAAKDDSVIRIGYIDYGSFIEKDSNGNYKGFGVEYLNEISRHTGWKYEYVYSTWEKCLRLLKEGKIDFIGTAQKTPEREEIYDFADLPNGVEQTILYTRTDNDDLYFEDYARLEGKRIGLLTDSFQTQFFVDYAKEHNFSFISVYRDTEESMVAALKSGKIDVMVGGSLALHKTLKVIGKEGADPFYFMTYKGNDKTLTELNDAMREIQKDDPYYLQELAKKYYGESVVECQPQFTREEAEYIHSLSTIRVGCLSDCYPISRWNEKKNMPEGIVIDIMDNLAEEMDVEVEYVPIPVGTSPTEYLFDGTIDVALPCTQNAYQNTQGILISKDIMPAEIVPVMREDRVFETGRRYRVAVMSDFKEIENIIGGAVSPNFTPVYCSSLDECLRAVRGGRADVYFDNYYILAYRLKSPFYEKQQENYGHNFEADYGISTAEGREMLIQVFDKAIEALDGNQVNDIIGIHTLNDNYHYSFSESVYSNRYAVIVGLLLVFSILMAGVVITVLLRRNVKVMQGKNRQLEAANLAKSNFLSNMSHEIRTPMNAIIGMTNLALKVSENPDETQEYLSKIDNSSQYLLGILNDVLDMSRIERGKIELHPQWVNPHEILFSCISMLDSTMRQKKITFSYPKVLRFYEVQYYIDPLRTKQIFMNIMNNAVKFTPPGGSITLEYENEELDAHRCRDTYMVKDTGCGMSREFLEKIFEPFEQEENPYSNAVRGTGLGLSLVKEIIHAMGGSISVESELNKGTKFTIVLEYKCRANRKKAEKKQLPKTQHSLEGLHILLVDDHPLNREIAGKLLEKAGITVEMAVNGAEALEKMEQSKVKAYDAVLMDIRMPVMDGHEAARRIRKLNRPDAGTIPIIAMTANAFDEDVQASADAGMNAHLAKPIEPRVLHNTLVRLCVAKEIYVSSADHGE